MRPWNDPESEPLEDILLFMEQQFNSFPEARCYPVSTVLTCKFCKTENVRAVLNRSRITDIICLNPACGKITSNPVIPQRESDTY